MRLLSANPIRNDTLLGGSPRDRDIFPATPQHRNALPEGAFRDRAIWYAAPKCRPRPALIGAARLSSIQIQGSLI